MTTGAGSWARLDGIGEERLESLREEAYDWLAAKTDDLPKRLSDADGFNREAEEVAALGRLVSGLERGEVAVPDPILRELVARETTEAGQFDDVKEEYDRLLAVHEGWKALLACLDSAAGAAAGAEEDHDEEPESPDHGEPVASAPGPSRRIEPAGTFSDDQLQIIRATVTRSLAGRTGDLGLRLKKRPEVPDAREVGEIAALARLAFGLEQGELEVPDRIAGELMSRIAAEVAHENEVEEIVERYEEGIAEHEALVAFASIFSEGSAQEGGER